ncbi:MAG: hypothetical protein ACU826_11795, partial [Gammaproteobacteria bacterium]
MCYTQISRRIGKNWKSIKAFALIPGFCFTQFLFAACPPPVKDFHQPACIDSVNGLLDVQLAMQTSTIDIGPQTLDAATYNDSLPGPTLRVKQGDRLQILLK